MQVKRSSRHVRKVVATVGSAGGTGKGKTTIIVFAMINAGDDEVDDDNGEGNTGCSP